MKIKKDTTNYESINMQIKITIEFCELNEDLNFERIPGMVEVVQLTTHKLTKNTSLKDFNNMIYKKLKELLNIYCKIIGEK